MKAYGLHFGMWRDEDYGPPSRHGKITAKHRSSQRRLLHKIGRRGAKTAIHRLLEESK